MDYALLTDEHKRAMWDRVVGQLEEQHYALTMDRMLAASVTVRMGEAAHPEIAARLKQLDAQLTAIEQQHAKAIAERATLEHDGTESIRDEEA